MVSLILLIVCAMFLSGMLGRMGGAGKAGNWYDFLLDTKWRDIGCPTVLLAFIWILIGLESTIWWAYALTWLFSFGAFTTYWDAIFGHDCLWFSGLMVGLAAFPLCWVDPMFFWIVPIRAVFLAITWELLNKKLPGKVFIWRRDVAEEFSRYAISL